MFGSPSPFQLAMLAVAMASRINIGIRHILPAFPFLAVIAAAGTMWLAESRPNAELGALDCWQPRCSG